MTSKIMFIAWMVCTIFTSSFVVAQEASTAEEVAQPAVDTKAEAVDASATKGVEKITVTGSHIKRIQVEGPSPVQVLDREQLDRTGYNSVSDVLRDLSGNSFGSQRENSGTDAADVSTVSLRGQSTLVLLNGKRLPKDGVLQEVDLSNVPMGAVDRIEILKDGASALYGSDAIGGVVNIITKKDFNGQEISFDHSFNEADIDNGYIQGSRTQLSYLHGFSNDKLSLTNSVFFRHNEKAFSDDREFTSGRTSSNSPVPNYKAGAAPWATLSTCPNNVGGSGPQCKFEYSKFSTEIPTLSQLSWMMDGTYELTPVTELFFRTGLSYKRSEWTYAPTATGPFVIPGATMGSFPPTVDGALAAVNTTVLYRFNEIGNRENEIETLAATALVGAETEVMDSWELETSVSYNRIERKVEGENYVLIDKSLGAMAAGDYNPFAAVGSKAVSPTVLDEISYNPFEKVIVQLAQVDAILRGELTDQISVAIGVQGVYENYDRELDPETAKTVNVGGQVYNSNVFGNSGGSGGGNRQAYSFFTEFSYLPIDQLEIQLAGRYDYYDDFGSTINPKLAARYQPNNKWMIRSSVGTGFKAPNLNSLYGNGSAGVAYFKDQVFCDAVTANGGSTQDDIDEACDTGEYSVSTTANTKLEEETFLAANLGAVYQATKFTSFGLDLWFLNLNNEISSNDYEAITRAEANGVDLQSILGANAVRDAGDNMRLTGVGLTSKPINVGKKKMFGLDISADMLFPLDSGHKLGVEFEGSYLIYLKKIRFTSLPEEDVVGIKEDQTSANPQWRANLTFTHQLPDTSLPLSHSLTTRVIDGYTCSNKAGGCEVDMYFAFDYRLVWKTKKTGDLIFGIYNLLDQDPPLDENVNLGDRFVKDLYDARGRYYTIGYKYSF